MNITLPINLTKRPLRVAVIGAGMMGENHLRTYNMLHEVELVAVVDTDAARAQKAAEKYGCIGYTQIEDILGKVDAVTIAVPSTLHAEIGLFFLSNGIHCLIEKPLAVTEIDCLRLIEMAEKKRVILLVGHVEHFNPAVQQLARIIGEGHTIQAIDIQRMHGNNQRATDVDVVMDLMIHDLEIVNSLILRPAIHLSAHAVAHSKNKGADYVSTLISFVGDTIANITASRITQNKVRRLAITADFGYITLDYNTQELLIYRQTKGTHLLNCDEYTVDQTIERVLVRPMDPLMNEVQNFIQSIHTGIPLGVDGHRALAALKLGWQIQEQIAYNKESKEKSCLSNSSFLENVLK
jgi:predicted dehydrogenase